MLPMQALLRLAPRLAFPTRSYALGSTNYPARLPSIDEVAKRLGFEKGIDMYPEYPLESPPELWMVTQVKMLKFRPYWEKEAMKDMGLYRTHDISIQMNTPETNERLWQVKHLVKIQPIRFPNGYPTEEDIGGTFLKGNGEFIIFKRLEEAEEAESKDLAPLPKKEEWKVVDGYRMCRNCKQKRCYRLKMCQKLWMQRGKNNIEKLGPRMFNFVDPPTSEHSEEKRET